MLLLDKEISKPSGKANALMVKNDDGSETLTLNVGQI